MPQVLLSTVHLPDTEIPVLGGFVLIEEGSADWTVDFHSNWMHLSTDEAEVLDAVEVTLRIFVQECKNPGLDFVELLESQLSNTVRCGERLTPPHVMPVLEQRQLLRAAFGVSERPQA